MKKLLLLVSVLVVVVSVCACGGGSNGGSSDSTPIASDEIQALYTTPSDFKGRTYDFTGIVISVEKDSGTTYLQVMRDIDNYEQNTIIEYDNADLKIKEEDYVKVSGTILGEFEGENALGTKVTAPHVKANSVEVVSAVEAFPAEKTIDVNQTVTKGPCEATVTKVDYTEDETRVYVTVKNNGSAPVDMYADSGVIIQNGMQIEPNNGFRYDSMPSEIKAGASVQGVVAFDRIEESAFTFIFDGYDNDFNDFEFKFEVAV